MEFAFDTEYDERLYEARHVGFETVLEAICTEQVLFDFARASGNDSTERVLTVPLIDGAYYVPYVAAGKKWILQTVYPAPQFNHLFKKPEATVREPAYLNEEERETIEDLRSLNQSILPKLDASAFSEMRKAAARRLKRQRKGATRISPEGIPGTKEHFGEIAGRVGKIGRW